VVEGTPERTAPRSNPPLEKTPQCEVADYIAATWPAGAPEWTRGLVESICGRPDDVVGGIVRGDYIQLRRISSRYYGSKSLQKPAAEIL
jgi:hypothetical protein